MLNLYDVFLAVARALASQLGVTPLLFGSLGLSLRLHVDLQPDDIDVLVPEAYLADLWPSLQALMERLGFALIDLHEHAFAREGVHLAYASLESLEPFAGVECAAIPMVQDQGCAFFLLSLEDYWKVYTASATDGYRQAKKEGRDQKKIALISAALQGQR